MLRRVVSETDRVPEVLTSSLVALIMEEVSNSETSVNFDKTTRLNIPEDSHLHTRCRENLKSHMEHNHHSLPSTAKVNALNFT
jgi:hypothetical protein